MGSVYLGESPTGRRVAVKVIKSELSSDPDFRARFRGEVKRARQVPPFCTAEVLDADAEHATPYLVVEYVEGPSLAEIVQDRGPLAGGALHSVAIGVATALAAIHDAGVVHRDLKPANVLFSLGTPKVIDFGIAKALDTTSQHTIPGQILGTIAYMGPERFDADNAAHVGPSTDIFAWGAIVTYAATGHTPYAPDSLIATAGGVALPAADLADLPLPLRDLVASALHQDPQQRPTAHELLELLLKAGAAGNASIRAGLDQRPELERAAAAVRRTVRYHQPIEQGGRAAAYHRLGTLVQRKLWRTRWQPPGAVAGITAVALAAGIATYPAAQLVLPGTNTHGSAPRAPAIDDDRENVTDDRASRGGSRGSCTLDGVLEMTPQAPRFSCPASGSPTRQTVHAQVKFGTAGACAAIWTHVSGDDGYQITACTDHVSLTVIGGGRRRTLAYADLDQATDSTRWHQIDAQASNGGITVDFDQDQVIRKNRTLPTRVPGAVMLGLAPDPNRPGLPPDAHITLTNVSVTSTS
jgi:hypothetical protein